MNMRNLALEWGRHGIRATVSCAYGDVARTVLGARMVTIEGMGRAAESVWQASRRDRRARSVD